MLKFFIGGDVNPGSGGRTLQMSERNAKDLLAWLSFSRETWGALPSAELAARCRRRLWPHPRNVDPAIPEQVQVTLNGQVQLLQLGREEGYLRKRTEELLALAEKAGPEQFILFST